MELTTEERAALRRAEQRAMSYRPPPIISARDKPTWVVALWLALLTLVGGMVGIACLMWVVSRRF
jgi:hypothetical protein